MNKRTLLIVGGIVAAFFLCICVAVVGYFGYQTIQKTTAMATEVVTQLENIEVPTIVFEEEPTVSVPSEPTEAPEIVVEQATEEVQQDTGTLSEEDARYAAGNFVLDLSNRDYASATEMTIDEMRNNADTPGQLQDLVENQGFEPVIWEWLDTQINGELADLTGVINFADNRRGKVEVQVTAVNGYWLINYIHFTTDGASVDPGALSTWDDQRTTEELAFATATADYFIINWAGQDYDSAFLLCAQPMKDDVGSAEKIQEVLGGLGVTPDTWTWESHEFIEVDGQTQPVIELVGTMQYAEGSSGPAVIQLMWEGGFWSVLYIDVKTK